jgi:electron transport complex protein RnfD
MPATTAPHTSGPRSVGFIMAMVMLALVPGTLLGIVQFGWPALNLFVLTIVTALAAEAASLIVAGKPVRVALMDGSAVLTAWLLALSLPPWAPWWIGVVGAMFAIAIGKHLFGGLGQNVFNPAMLARTVLLISFPVEMTAWIAPQPMFSAHAPGFSEGLAITFGQLHLDAVSSASLLGHVKTTLGIDGHAPLPAIIAGSFHPLASFMGTTAGSLGETSALLFIAGGLFLIYLRIISWHIPAAMLATVGLLAWATHLANPLHFSPPLFHLLNGGLMLGAFFIATDPVTSPVSNYGKLVFGAGCGVLVFIIRQWGGYPEGVAFAVLLMNAATPLIDHYIRPRIFGRTLGGEPLPMAGKEGP